MATPAPVNRPSRRRPLFSPLETLAWVSIVLLAFPAPLIYYELGQDEALLSSIAYFSVAACFFARIVFASSRFPRISKFMAKAKPPMISLLLGFLLTSWLQMFLTRWVPFRQVAAYYPPSWQTYGPEMGNFDSPVEVGGFPFVSALHDPALYASVDDQVGLVPRMFVANVGVLSFCLLGIWYGRMRILRARSEMMEKMQEKRRTSA